ncbi:hypothetical protein I4U23_013272 [Adineta vaga]|nr:hypothetical protein I4U23_013272 [Adineta vaga]
MIASTIPLLVVLLITSQCMDAYPSASSTDLKINHHPLNFRLKRDFGYLQRHELANIFNDDTPEESLPYGYSFIARQNRKRLIDF